MTNIGTIGPDGLHRLKWGMAECWNFKGKFVFDQNENGEFKIDKDVVKSLQKNGYPTQNCKKHYHFQTSIQHIK